MSASALVYSDLISPQFYQIIFDDSQSGMARMARGVYAELEASVADPDAVLQRIKAMQPLVSRDHFSVLSGAKTSPHRTKCHEMCEAAARVETADTPDDQTARAAGFVLKWLMPAGKHYFRDHLAGGRYHPDHTDDALKKKMLLVPPHNNLCESVFAQADYQMKSKSRTASTSTMSMHTLAAMNKPLAWWATRTAEQKHDYEMLFKDKHGNPSYRRRTRMTGGQT